jgi:hypothetical protein
MRKMIAVLVLALAACESATEFTEPTAESGPPVSATVVAGQDQTGTVAAELALDLRATIHDAEKSAVPSTPISWAGDGEAWASTTVTNADGSVTNRWTLGTTAGEQTLEARWIDPATGEGQVLATFRATAEPGPGGAFSFTRDSGLRGYESQQPWFVDFTGESATDIYGNDLGSDWEFTRGSGPTGLVLDGQVLRVDRYDTDFGFGKVLVTANGGTAATLDFAICYWTYRDQPRIYVWMGDVGGMLDQRCKNFS